MHDPSTAQGDDSDLEWIEIYSNETGLRDLSKWQINGNDFDDINISSNQYIIIARQLIDDPDADAVSFESYYGNNDSVWNKTDANFTAVDGSFGSGLSGSNLNFSNGTTGENIMDLSGRGGNGNGNTIERYNFVNLATDESTFNGTPGAQNSIFSGEFPIASLASTPSVVAENAVVQLNASASSDDVNITRYRFNLSNGTIITQSTPIINFTFALNGSFSAILTVSDKGDLNNTVSKSFNISFENDLPIITGFNLTFAEDGFNDTFNLNPLVSDEETSDANINWTAANALNVIVNITDAKILNVSGTSNFNGFTNFTLIATDENNGKSNITVFVNISAVNDAPEFNSSNQISNLSIVEDTNTSFINLTNHFFDIDSSTLTFNASPTNNITITINQTTAIAFIIPDANFTGNRSVNFTATDGLLTSNSSNTITLSVTNVNDIPTITPFNISFSEDSFNVTNLTQKVTDLEDNAANITFSATTSKNLTIVINNSILNVSADNNFNGLVNFTLIATDLDNGTSNTTVFVNVTKVNDAPIIANISNRSITQESLVSFTVTASDLDGDNLTFTKNVNFGTLNGTSGLFTFTPNETFYREQRITFTASDGTLSDAVNTTIFVFSTLNISSVGLSHNPTFASLQEGQIIQNIEPFSKINVTVALKNVGSTQINDINVTLAAPKLGIANLKTESFLASSSSTSKQINLQLPAVLGQGLIDFTIAARGRDDITNKVRFSNFSFTLNVSKKDHDVIIQNLTLDNDSVKCTSPVNLLLNITNIGKDNTEEVFVAITQKNLKLNRTASFDPFAINQTAIITETINTGNVTAATYTIKVEVKFNKNQTSITETQKLTIQNCEPVAATIPNITLAEGSFNTSINLSQFYTDFNNDSLFFAFEGGKNLAVTITNGQVNISSPTNFNGNSTINFTGNDASNLTKSNQVQVQVTGVNDAPNVTTIANQTATQGINFTLQVTATDVENDSLTFALVANDTISIKINQSGFIHSFVPNASEAGKVFLMNLSVSDAQNTTQKQFTITVININDAPVFNTSNQIANITLAEDSNKTINISKNFFDADQDILTFSSTNPANISIIFDTSKAIIIPNANFTGLANVSFRASDASSTSNASNRVIINVTPVNDRPVFTNFTDQVQAVIGVAKTITIKASDVDKDTLTFTDNTTLFNISTTGVIFFTPTTSNIGKNVVRIHVSDGTANTSRTMTINVVDVLSLSNIRASINNGGNNIIPQGSTFNNLSPGKKLRFTVNVTNNLENTNINLARVNISFTRNNVTELNKVASLGTLNKNTNQDVQIDLGTLPFVPNGNYSLTIKVTGQRETTPVSTVFTAKAIILGQANQILITSTAASPSSLTCLRNSTVSVTVKNADGFQEAVNASVTVTNTALGINAGSSSKKINFSQEKSFTIPIGLGLTASAGTYNLTATAAATAGTQTTDSVSLQIQGCALTVSPVKDPIITSSASQTFSVTSFSDFPQNTISWFLDGINQTASVNSASFTYTPDNKTGRRTHSIVVQTKDNNSNLLQRAWTLTTTSFPIADTVSTIPDLSKLNETQLHAVNLTIVKSGTGKVVFSEAINLSNIPNLDAIINFSTGIIAVEVSGANTVFNKAAQITLEALTYTNTPKILFSNSFTTNPADFTQDCTNTFCKIISVTDPPTNDGTVVFNVSHFSSYLVNTTSVTATPGNTAPSVNAGSDQIVNPGTTVTLTGSASDSDGTIASVTWTQLSGTTVALSTTTAAATTFTAPSGTATLTFQLTAIDDDGASASDTVTVRVEERDKLVIKDIDVRVDDDTDKNLQNGDKISKEAKPGDTVKFDIEVANEFSSSADIDIEDIELEITIKDIDDGDDLEETVDIDDLKAGDDDSVTVTFTIPSIVEEEIYEVEIIVDGDSDNGTQRDVVNLELEVEKDNNELLIDRARLSPSFLSCDRTATLSTRVVNIGSNDQDDVEILIESVELDLERRFFGIALEEGDDPDDVARTEALTISVPAEQAPGIYPVRIQAFYNRDRLADERTVSLEVSECQQRQVTPVLLDSIPTNVVTIPSSAAPAKTPTTISFRESSTYTTLLISAFIILLGAVIFAFGTTMILLKRK